MTNRLFISLDIPDDVINRVKQVCIYDPDINCKKIISLAKYIKLNGYPIYNVIKQIQAAIINEKNLTESDKSLTRFSSEELSGS